MLGEDGGDGGWHGFFVYRCTRTVVADGSGSIQKPHVFPAHAQVFHAIVRPDEPARSIKPFYCLSLSRESVTVLQLWKETKHMIRKIHCSTCVLRAALKSFDETRCSVVGEVRLNTAIHM